MTQTDWRSRVEDQVPRLAQRNYLLKSKPSVRYNCIAWAAGDGTRIWSPTLIGSGVYWPPGIPAFPTLSGTAEAFEMCGYTACGPTLPPRDPERCEMVAIFTNRLGEPLHAARQLANGVWVSKLGDHCDIEHDDVDAVGGGLYGEPALFMERRRQGSAPVPPEPIEIIQP